MTHVGIFLLRYLNIYLFFLSKRVWRTWNTYLSLTINMQIGGAKTLNCTETISKTNAFQTLVNSSVGLKLNWSTYCLYSFLQFSLYLRNCFRHFCIIAHHRKLNIRVLLLSAEWIIIYDCLKILCNVAKQWDGVKRSSLVDREKKKFKLVTKIML